MIPLSSLSGNEFFLNCDMIVKIEALPDTVITLTDGRAMRVKESPEKIIEEIVKYKRKIHLGLPEVE